MGIKLPGQAKSKTNITPQECKRRNDKLKRVLATTADVKERDRILEQMLSNCQQMG